MIKYFILLILSAFLLASCSPQSTTVTNQNPCDIKGNINQQGEKTYHLKECDKYSQINISLKKGEKWFCSEAEAQAAGYKKSKNSLQYADIVIEPKVAEVGLVGWNRIFNNNQVTAIIKERELATRKKIDAIRQLSQ